MTNWTWDYIDDFMTIPRLEALIDYWQQSPPLARSVNEIRMILKSYFGIKDDGKKVIERPIEPKKMSDDEFHEQALKLSRFLQGAI